MRRGIRKYIRLLGLVVAIVFLYSFSGNRNEKRKRTKFDIHIRHDQNLFLTDDMVYQDILAGTNQQEQIDSLDLNGLEIKLRSYGLIENAEVYETITKNVGIDIRQREPIARVLADTSYYIDRNGERMPLSPAYSARVPLITQVNGEHAAALFPLLQRIDQDEFLKQEVIGIRGESSGDYKLLLRQYDFQVNFGSLSAIERKISNFKAFYKKAKRDSLLNQYSEINLKYTNQVVCTKIEV